MKPMAIMDKFLLNDGVAVITGAGRGIGEGIAHSLAGAGAAVVLAARRENEVQKVADDINAAGGRAIAVATDVTDKAAVEALADKAVAEFGKLTVWVNNAGGASLIAPLSEMPMDHWQASLDLNLTSVFVATVVAAERMTEGGSIINISSRAAWGPVPGSGHYAAAKAGVHSLTATFAHELGPNIRVNTIAPGFIPTEISMQALQITEEDLPSMVQAFQIPLGKLGQPSDIGSAVQFLASPASSWMTGQIWPVTGGS
jgi:NAD(P)-dependent dehydrogenase (short-subunit alcohol dehydrogenase family)